jgi:hypothetical protein
MKRHIITLSFLLTFAFHLSGQVTDQFVSNCVINAGTNAKYLKDFRIQLGKATTQNELRFKVNFSLWKNTKYRFTMCSTEDSKGQLIINIKDDSDNLVLSSADQKSGKTYSVVDFECSKSGIYKLNYYFTDGLQGSGVGVVSLVK